MPEPREASVETSDFPAPDFDVREYARTAAASHRDEAASSREELDSKFQHADSLDPRRKDDADAAYALAEKERAKHEDPNNAELNHVERTEHDQLQPTQRTERDPQHRVVN